LRAVVGFENVKFFRPGYAIEYDYFPPTQLKHTLETKTVDGLFFAGQINGTTGYEEAASQGIMAGINAHQHVANKSPFILSRDEAYIGVLIDDLITKGTEEPYRMFTSRAEYRTLLRQDNADVRLTPKAHAVGLATDERLQQMERQSNKAQSLISFFNKTSIRPEQVNPILLQNESAPVKQSLKMSKVLARPNITIEDLLTHKPVVDYVAAQDMDAYVLEQAEIQIKYAGYIAKEKAQADKLTQLDHVPIPKEFDYEKVKSLSIEARQKLSKIKPVTIAQASRISGVSPSDLSVLLVYMGR